MSEQKRKGAPRSDSNPAKRKKAGNSGKWQTPHQRSKPDQRGVVEPGYSGIWVTCARSQEARAAREVQLLFDEYAEKLYNVTPRDDAVVEAEDEDEDIEASIQRELTSMKPKDDRERPRDEVFTILRQSVDCLLFVKTREPIEPVEFAHHICVDAKTAADPKSRRSRYLNRLTPITLVGRASDKGVEEVCEKVLPQWFVMKRAKDEGEQQKAAKGAEDAHEGSVPAASAAGGDDKEKPAYTYAIRATTRNQCPLKRGDVINQIAGMIDDRHKVNLGSPDKVILVDMYQNIYGMSVVDGDWDDLKRYNISELYNQAGFEAEKSKKEQGASSVTPAAQKTVQVLDTDDAGLVK
ncbi:hypothetical protein MAPG_03616 [Magnaporthiopsis poae ATCC 64411]|uniref:THUMP domain-containing protein n=1 Tax=Magnaporthiopsis poae (strain ATCC 64411 / 73-15) TaxID=644358 RepID=A0A0C4DUH7_MAGP6|nr:hypothetical protein MAPG_03616 [Magnaporthiopsis poae ATCC 64411]